MTSTSDHFVSSENTFNFEGSACVNLVKLKLIKEFVKIEKPNNFNKDKFPY